MRCNHKGQVTAETAVLFSFVIAGFVFMGFYLQRAAQGSTKANTDSIGVQFSTDSPWNSHSASASYERNDAAVNPTASSTESDSCSTGSHSVGVGVRDGLPTDDCVPGSFAGSSDSILTAPTAGP